MTIRQLRIFITVCELQNMTKAAEVLYTTQSSISQVILDIEKEYNVVLFERLKNQLCMTESGKQMLTYAKRIIADYDELTNMLKADSNNKVIKVGASVTAGSTMLYQILEEFLKENPGVKYKTLVAGTHIIEDGLVKNELDIGIVEGVIKNDDIIEEKLCDDPLVVICSPKHRLANKEKIKFNEIINEPIIVREEGSGTRKQFIGIFEKMKVEPNIVSTCNTQQAAVEAVKRNLGISVMSRSVVEKEIEEGTICVCDIDGYNFNRSYRIVYHKDKFMSEVIKKFIAITKSLYLK